jgi:hypothetical protein
MMSANSESFLGQVNVVTADNRGFTPEEIADYTVNKIISIGEQSHPVIIEQAKAFKGYIREVLVESLRNAQQSERTTICAKLAQAGHNDISQIIRSL